MSPSFPYTYAVVLRPSTALVVGSEMFPPRNEENEKERGQGKRPKWGRQPRKAVCALSPK